MNNELILGVDVGGSHISAALVNFATGELVNKSVRRKEIAADGKSGQIIQQWADTLKASLSSLSNYRLKGIGVAIPGPFNYSEGISLINGLNKYDDLYGMNIKRALMTELNLTSSLPFCFENDAACFGLGESLHHDSQTFKKIIAITLGTGFGSTFLIDKKIHKEGKGIPPNGELYNMSYLEGTCEDYISGKWILNTYNRQAEVAADNVYTIAQRAKQHKEDLAIRIFHEFGAHLALCLDPWIKAFGAECIIIGGSIAKSSFLFLPVFIASLQKQKLFVPIKISEYMELSAIKGAAELVIQNNLDAGIWRKSTQALLPTDIASIIDKPGEYNIYPSFSIGDGKIFSGYDSLAEWILTRQLVMIDGFPGNDWEDIRKKLSAYFDAHHIDVSWYDTAFFEKPVSEISALIEPFIGEPGDVWGKRTGLSLAQFYDTDKLAIINKNSGAAVHILIGTGAAIAGWESLIYVDLPKNEIQYRMRAGKRVSLGTNTGLTNAEIYKRLYFVDWVVNKQHRQSLHGKIDVVADGQWKDTITWAFSEYIYEGIQKMSNSVIRARPWFEPGAWGGQWLKRHIPQLNQEEVNYAWSFELIVPENGVVLESAGKHLEIAFDWLMEKHADAILGPDVKTFGTEFPIRFDYLDTVDGGNLSIQCHPSKEYIAREFGENFTQDETYYILDCEDDATVYLGFQENIDPLKFKSELEESAKDNTPVEITDYVQVHPAKKHDLFLIPNQTIHSAGKNNLVLEISATPYIFTFKMYDWLRLDLEGNPRPINIDHAFKNLDFSRKGSKVQDELISRPVILEQTVDHKLVHLPTHPEHFYDVHRIEFRSSVKIQTQGKCMVMMLVEGESIQVQINGKEPMRLNYAETFVIPAAAGSFEMINEGKEEVKVIKAFIK